MPTRYRFSQRVGLWVVALGVALLVLWTVLLAWLFTLKVEKRRESLMHAAF